MTEVNLIFFDHDNDKIAAYEKHVMSTQEWPFNVHCIKQDVKDLLKLLDVQIIVSPANSLGFMDGGIDMVYMQLFPGIQQRVQEAIATYDIETNLGRKVLPIGSCKLVRTLDHKTPMLACVPTMFLPENITQTHNVYWATRGLLLSIERLRNRQWPNNRINVAIPCFGTGVGQMTGEEAGSQVAEALRDHDPTGESFITEEMQNRGVKWKTQPDDPNVVLSGMACRQPTNYANMEIDPDTAPEDLIKRVECRS